ncbi:sensor histidine kinase [Streptomyces sp. NPDC050504]|uniref:sensor histidine kinase n=1 Tax=Streptomyces sp. NPDC050504 TaxID=3365618 RepID=UPI0037BCE0BE
MTLPRLSPRAVSWQCPPRLVDVFATLLSAGLTVLAVIADEDSGLSTSRTADLALIALVALCALPLLLRRRIPELSLVASLAATLSTNDSTPLIFSTWAVGRYGRCCRAGWLAAAAAVYALTRPLVGDQPWSADVLYYLVANILAPALIGALLRRQEHLIDAVRGKALRAEAAVEQAAEYAVLEERTRLAFDMHDSIGHHVAVIVLQAAAIRARAGRPDEVRAAAGVVEHSARAAMDELREILDILGKDPSGPIPPARLSRVGYEKFMGTLVRNMRTVGVAVTCSVEGEPVRLPKEALDVLYVAGREGLTNAIKYSPGSPIRLLLEFQDQHVEFAMENGAPRMPGTMLGGSGIGLRSIGTRVRELGGTLDAAPTPGGGFALRVRIPTLGKGPDDGS